MLSMTFITEGFPVSSEIRNRSKGGEGHLETDEEDELDLLFDPVLNCYFDPKTCKYYELVGCG